MPTKITHLDLFSGIGGFAYAADQVWDNVEHIFCDNDPFCREVLNKHWPESEIIDDIKSITADTKSKGSPKSRETRRPTKTGRARWRGFTDDNISVDLLTGGFPCQPFSAAGVRKGTSDERYLWPEMLRVIQLTKPSWVIAENVRGLLTWENGLVFEQVCTDLEDSGYQVQPVIIPAVAVNAPHRRDRIWWVAHPSNSRLQGSKQPKTPSKETRTSRPIAKRHSDAKNPISQRSRGRSKNGRQILERQSSEAETPRPNSQGNTGDTKRKGLERVIGNSQQKQEPRPTERCRGSDWEKDWLEVATELCGVDARVSARVDGFSPAQHRKERLKGLGNAIVPQVAVEIMKGIKYAHTR